MFSILSALTLASAQSVDTSDFTNVTLITESNHSSYDSQYFTGMHEGAGISGVYLTNVSSQFFYNTTGNFVVYPVEIADMYPMLLNEYSSTLTFGVTGPPLAEIHDGYVTINGSTDVFQICDTVPMDPYNYTGSLGVKGVSVYGANDSIPDSCVPIKIRAEFANSTVSPSSSIRASMSMSMTMSARHSASANSSAHISASHSASHSKNATTSHHSANGTLTTRTETNHTTITIPETTWTLSTTTETFTKETTTTSDITTTETLTIEPTASHSNAANQVKGGVLAGVLAVAAALI